MRGDGGGAIGGVLLAAGAGTRFGGPKALAVLEGEPLAERGARLLLRSGCDPVVVVLGARAGEVAGRIDVAPAEVVVNDRWASGIGSSLAAGLRALQGRCDAAVIALADQPMVRPAACTRLAEAWAGGALAAMATYGGAPRNPVLLDARLWERAIARAEGDRGARAFLRAHPSLATHVPCDDVAAPDDVDTPADLAAIAAAVSALPDGA